MDNEVELNNSGQSITHNNGNETVPLHRTDQEEYDINALPGAEDHVNTNQDKDDKEQSSENGKRFTAEQIQELES
jgi:homeobox-leucine zipper protein